MQELISVVIPVYNVERYIERCVDSVINQVYRNLEIILVNDGSTDSSGEICDKYDMQDSRIKVIHKQNGGLSEARNEGISISTGAYITFIDSDDWVSPYYISNLYNAIQEDGAEMAISWFENVFENRKINSTPVDFLQEYSCLDTQTCLEKMFYQNGIETCACGKLYVAELFQGLRYPVGKLYEDIFVTYSAMIVCSKIALVANVDYYYFQRLESIQNQKFSIKKLDAISHTSEMMESVIKLYPQLKDAVICRYFSCVSNILFQIEPEEYDLIRNKLWNELKKYRKVVLKDHKARKKARLAALVSYMGYFVMKKVYERTQWRGKKSRTC